MVRRQNVDIGSRPRWVKSPLRFSAAVAAILVVLVLVVLLVQHATQLRRTERSAVTAYVAAVNARDPDALVKVEFPPDRTYAAAVIASATTPWVVQSIDIRHEFERGSGVADVVVMAAGRPLELSLPLILRGRTWCIANTSGGESPASPRVVPSVSATAGTSKPVGG